MESTNIPDMDKMVAQYGDSLLRMSFLYLKDFHLAQDAVQDTFLKIYKSYGSFKGYSSEKTWIIRININVCKNYMRINWWNKTDGIEILENIVSDKSNTDDYMLMETIMKLSKKYREVILLYYYQELKIREIAQVLHIPEASISTRLKRAREKLKIEIKEEFFNE